MRSAAQVEFFLSTQTSKAPEKKKSNNGAYRWFVARGVALGATEVDKESKKNGFKKIRLPKENKKKEPEFDRVTGLPNFKAFEQRVSGLIHQKELTNISNFGIIIISMQNQEMIADDLSRKEQSIVINEIVYRITECLRESDYLARTHWNEFSLIIQNLESDSEVLVVKNRITQQLAYPLWMNGARLKIEFKIDSVIRNNK